MSPVAKSEAVRGVVLDPVVVDVDEEALPRGGQVGHLHAEDVGHARFVVVAPFYCARDRLVELLVAVDAQREPERASHGLVLRVAVGGHGHMQLLAVPVDDRHAGLQVVSIRVGHAAPVDGARQMAIKLVVSVRSHE